MTELERNEIAQLREQLEQLRRECGRSAAMTAEIIAAFGEAFRRERRARKDSSPEVVLETGGVTLPLGVKEQIVSIPPSAAVRQVSATALCGDSSKVVLVRLGVRRGQGVREVTGEPQNGAATAPTELLVRLAAGEARTLFTVDPCPQATEFALCRVGGEPCVVSLHIDSADDATRQSVRGKDAQSGVDGANRTSSKGTLWKAQELLRDSRVDRAMEVALAYATDVERPAIALLRATLAKSDADWITNLNAYVEQFGITPVRLENKSGPRFLRLTADAPPAVSRGPLVTVIMPAFNAQNTLELAAGSILKQSWTELELIIIDDCSSDGTWEIAQHMARLDPRVRLRRNSVNVGPYVSKNLALATARGDYITCHDADDWAHPQRVTRQIEALRANCARACVASWLRLDEAGRFCGFTAVGRQSHDGALRVAHVTCMIEADFMRRYVGHWDSVRFGADGEMLERLGRLLDGNLLYLRLPAVLSLDAPRSLTNHAAHGISRLGGLSPTRRAYRDAWRLWHATLTDGAYIEFPQRARPFAAPDECVVPVTAMESVSSARTTF